MGRAQGEPLIDFPVSWQFHRMLTIQNEGWDPGPSEPDEPDTVQPAPALQQTNDFLRGQVAYLQNQIDELRRELKNLREPSRKGTKL